MRLAPQERQEVALVLSRFRKARHLHGEVGAMPEHPVEAPGEIGMPLRQPGVEHLHRAERDEPHQRTHAKRRLRSVRQDQGIVEEAVLLVPQPPSAGLRLVGFRCADMRHGGGDDQEVLEELRCDVFIDCIGLRQFQRHAHEVQRVHRHPGGGIGLLEGAAAGDRGGAIEDADIVEAEEAALKEVAPL